MLRLFTRPALSLFVASAPTRSASFIAAFAAQSPSSPTSCQAMTATPECTSDLPRWDLSRFGFSSPFSDDIDSHLDETAKLAEAFKVRTYASIITGDFRTYLTLFHTFYLKLYFILSHDFHSYLTLVSLFSLLPGHIRG